MSQTQPTRGFLAAMLDYFGPAPGQSKAEFGKEVQRLPEADKQEFSAMLTAIGRPHLPPGTVAATPAKTTAA